LFLHEGSNDYYEAYWQNREAAEEQAREWHLYLSEAATRCAEIGCAFNFICLPNKASVLADLYPLPLPEPSTPRLQILFDLSAGEMCLPFRMLTDQQVIRALFRRNDTHLTPLGNYIATKSLLNRMGCGEGFTLDSFTFRRHLHPGDLGYRFEPVAMEEAVCTELSERVTEQILRHPAGSHVGLTTLIINEALPTGKTAMVFGNSFFERYQGWGMMAMFARRFSKVIFQWSAEIDLTLVREHSPDYVILQTCERFLGKPPRSFDEIHPPPEQLKPPTMPTVTTTNSNSPATVIINLDAEGFIRCDGLPTEETQLWYGGRMLATVPGSAPELLLGHITRATSGAGSRDDFSLRSKDGTKTWKVEPSQFLENYVAGDDLLRRMREAVGPGKWEVWSIGIENGCVVAHLGGVLPATLAGAVRKMQVRCNGVPAHRQADWEDIYFGASHWFMPKECIFGMECSFQVSLGDFLTFELLFDDSVPTEIARQYRTVLTVCNLSLLKDMPALPRIQRVSGHLANAISFINSGKTAHRRLSDILSCYRKRREPGTSLQVLDWGVGCGRVARFFAEDQRTRVSGIDIDADNVNWCRENLVGNYLAVDLTPPTQLPDGEFDMIYSCSVLSHLSKMDAHKWLEELSRLLKPDGLALLSFNGSSNLVTYLAKRPRALRSALNEGFFDVDTNSDLQGFVASDTYYRATFATDKWWRKALEKHFELLSVERSVVSGHQDIAVLRRKG
jgi:SAM-dependent methyltransferase